MRALSVVAVAAAFSASLNALAADDVKVFAAGSLRAVLTEVAEVWQRKEGIQASFVFGASGLLKERIEKGEVADVFASANTEHPAALVKAGLANEVKVFTRNEMCALATANLNVAGDTFLEVMLNPALKLGTSTPKADPSGDYAWLVFERAEKVRPGSFAKLDAKALKLTGGRDSPPPPAGKNAYAELMMARKADIFLTYCTNAALATREQAMLKSVALPASLAVGADYGVTVMKKATPKAESFVAFLLSTEGQALFRKHGFGPVAIPTAGR